ncbi:MAG: acetyl-CoA decarbonylase/synthase complex subunit delta [Pseudomonadota bacterium]
MAFEIPKQPYSGKIGVTTIGKGGSSVMLGGEEVYPFHLFEGKIPNPPRIAMEVWDYDPSNEWPKAAVEPFKDVISSPDEWAKKCVKEYGADIIVLQLKSTDPNGMDRDANEAAEIAKKVMDAVDVPIVVWGTANNQKDEEVLKKISEVSQGRNVALAPVEEGNYKGVGASALGYGNTIVASSPIDVNLAKQLNILLGNLGLKSDKILIDPTTGGLGYGLEYSYSVMERIRMAALTQEDDKLQNPILSNVGNEIWKSKEAGQSIEDAPTLGDPERRGILMETVAAVSYLLAGANMVILRHPESVRFIRSFIDLLINGGMATDMQGITKRLEAKEMDLVSISPEPNLAIGGEVKAAVPKEKKAEAAPKPVEKKVAVEPKPEEKKPKEPPKPVEKVVELKPKAEDEAKRKAEEDAKARAEAEAGAKAEAEARAKAAEEAKKKAEEEADRKAEEEAKAKAAAKAKEQADLEALRRKMAEEKEKGKAEAVVKEEAVKFLDVDMMERLAMNLQRMHKHS